MKIPGQSCVESNTDGPLIASTAGTHRASASAVRCEKPEFSAR